MKNGLKAFDSSRDIEALTHFFKEEKVISIGILESKAIPIFEKEVQQFQKKIDLRKSHFVVLVLYEDPSVSRGVFSFPAEECFLISANEFALNYENGVSTALSYHFMVKALEGEKRPEQILVHQIGHPNPLLTPQAERAESAEVIMPHRGDLTDLKGALWYLQKQKVAPRRISVCFDEFVSDSHFRVADENSNTRFYVNFPSGVGPYPSRDILARGTEEEIIIFHDSDDVSTVDRVSVLTNLLKDDNQDAVGSHELRVNKIKKKLEAVRFPLNVVDVKNKQEKHCIFFPTTATYFVQI